MERFTVSRGAARLACVATGSGPGCMLLHAGVADVRVWAFTMAALALRWRAVAYDRRGFGDTVAEPESFSHVNDLRAVLDACELDRAVLIGNSMGGALAIDFALASPERVAALILVAPALTGDTGPYEVSAELQAIEDALEAADAAGDLAEINRLEARLWLDGPTCPEGRVSGDARALFLDMNGRALAATPVGEPVEPPAAGPRLGELAVPTLVVIGTLDEPPSRSLAARIADAIPDAELVTMPDVAHLPSLEAPDAFDAVVAAFLERLDR